MGPEEPGHHASGLGAQGGRPGEARVRDRPPCDEEMGVLRREGTVEEVRGREELFQDPRLHAPVHAFQGLRLLKGGCRAPEQRPSSGNSAVLSSPSGDLMITFSKSAPDRCARSSGRALPGRSPMCKRAVPGPSDTVHEQASSVGG